MNPNWVINTTKYQRALGVAKNPSDEAEVKAIYVSYGGLLGEIIVEAEITEEVSEVIPEVTEEISEVKKTKRVKKVK